MAQETWLLVAVAAGFLLLGIAASPLGWVAILNRRSQAEREGDRRFQQLSHELGLLQARVERCESSTRTQRERGMIADGAPGPVSTSSLAPGPMARRRSGRPDPPSVDGFQEPRLIAVPKLPAVQDRQAMTGGLSHRYAAIWDLAEAGASADAIARATGQPIGQIELILGLRRRVSGIG